MSETSPERWSHYNPVTVHEGLGTIILGIVSLVLLIALLRAEARNRRLLREHAETVRSARQTT